MRKFSATDLFTHEGHDFVSVSPVGTVPGDGAYNGCAVFRFEDLARGTIIRDRDARPHVEVFIELEKESFSGACAFVPEGPHEGLMIGQVECAARHGVMEPTFHIFRTEAVPGNAGKY